MSGYVYVLANRYRGTIYIGVTADIVRRTFQHREGTGAKFAKRYDVKRLVHVESCDSITDAIAREKSLKKWRRDWKIELIERDNPEWNDLWETINA